MFVRLGQIAGEAADIPSQHLGDGAQFIEGRIALAPLHPADVAGRSIRAQRQVLLGYTPELARLPNSLAEQLKRSGLFQPYKAR